MFGSTLLRHELAQDGARGFRSGIGCLGMILMTRDGRRKVRIRQIGVGSVMVVTVSLQCCLDNTLKPSLTGFLHRLNIHLFFHETHLIIPISYESAFYLLV